MGNVAVTSAKSAVRSAKGLRRGWKLAAVAAAVTVFLTLVVFFGIGRWLVVEDPLEKATAIVVLSGRMPVRALEAAKIYREGYAPEVWLTRSDEPGATLKAMGINFVGEDFYNLRVLMHEGVPVEAIHILPTPIVNTADEVEVILDELAREQGSTVILVTTKAHTRRVRALWRRMASAKGRAVVRAAEEDPFDAAHWWRNTSDALDVVRELLGLANTWMGLRMHPAAKD